MITLNLQVTSKEGQQYEIMDKVLLFDTEDIKELRHKYGIVGTLLGTLPSVKQQNTFLSVPLEIMPEEALWLVKHKVCQFAFTLSEQDQNSDHTALSDVCSIQKQNLLQQLHNQIQAKKQKSLENALKHGVAPSFENPQTDEACQLTSAKESSLIFTEKSLFVSTPTTSEHLVSLQSRILPSSLLYKDLENQFLRKHYTNYCLYSILKNEYSALDKDNGDNSVVLLPGSRFAGKYVLYPGDPLRYHSHLIVKDCKLPSVIIDNDENMSEKKNRVELNTSHINLLELICDGRLSTTVKKAIVVPFANDAFEDNLASIASDCNKSIDFYSVEWSGFG
ncbi:hypothetical protein ACO0QE_002965 [Hanseniaspora vineae]